MKKLYFLMDPMNIFTYGSLMFPVVMKAVTGREFSSRNARVKNHARFRVKGESYPGLTPLEGVFTDGVLYLNIDALSVKRLDDFEGKLYERARISAEALDGESFIAQAYLIKPQYRDRLSSEPWDPEHFEKADLLQFMASYGGFHRTDRSDPTDPTDRSENRLSFLFRSYRPPGYRVWLNSRRLSLRHHKQKLVVNQDQSPERRSKFFLPNHAGFIENVQAPALFREEGPAQNDQ